MSISVQTKRSEAFRHVVLLAFSVAVAIAVSGGVAWAEDHEHDDHDDHEHIDEHAGHGHTDALHFLHPLVVESPLPENEARLEFSYTNVSDGGGDEFTLTGTVEFAPVRWFSIEASAPFTHVDPDMGSSETRLGDVSVGFKFACFEFEEHGVLLAAGVELGLPTGNEERGIGNDHVLEIEPWVGFGVKRERFEWIARVGVGLPTNQNGDKEADAELEWGTSFLFHIIDGKLAALVEIDGLDIYGEEEDGYDSVSITPGVRIYPFDNPDVSLGMGVRLPVTTDRDSHAQGIFTLFFHF